MFTPTAFFHELYDEIKRVNYMGKCKLNPVKVPWKISASDEISLFQCENDRLEILLIADLFDSSKLKKLGIDSDFFDYMSIVQLRLVFETVLHFEYSRPQQIVFGLDPQKYNIVINPSAYDRSAFFQKWIDTKICPDPQMYQVEDSDIKRALNIKSDLMIHWILIGHDEIINIVSKKFIWEVVDYLQ